MCKFEIFVNTQGKVFESDDSDEAYNKYRELVRYFQETRELGSFVRVVLFESGERLAYTNI